MHDIPLILTVAQGIIVGLLSITWFYFRADRDNLIRSLEKLSTRLEELTEELRQTMVEHERRLSRIEGKHYKQWVD